MRSVARVIIRSDHITGRMERMGTILHTEIGANINKSFETHLRRVTAKAISVTPMIVEVTMAGGEMGAGFRGN
jgi:hypothetical protein